MRRLRPSVIGGRITTGSRAATALVIYLYTVAIGLAAIDDGSVKAQILIGGVIVGPARDPDRPKLCPHLRQQSQSAPGGRPQSRRRELRDEDPGRLGRPAEAGRPHLQRDAAPPRRARQRPQAVHRQRLARAADPDLQPRRLRRAARRGGPEPGGAGRVRAHDAPADRAPDEADDRPSRPLPARRRGRGDAGQRRRPHRPGARGDAGVRAAGRTARLAPGAADAGAAGDRPRRPRSGAADHPYPPRQRPHPHPRGHRRHRDHLLRQRPCRADRLRRGIGHPAARPEADLRALLHRRQGWRLRPRAGDRHRARPADEGRDHDQLQPPLHRLHPRPPARPRASPPRGGPPAPRSRPAREAPGHPPGPALRWGSSPAADRGDEGSSGSAGSGSGAKVPATPEPEVIDRHLQPRLRRHPHLRREPSPGVVTIRSVFDAGAAEGSGFVLDRKGEIVTNAHVVTDESSGDREAAEAGLRRVP